MNLFTCKIWNRNYFCGKQFLFFRKSIYVICCTCIMLTCFFRLFFFYRMFCYSYYVFIWVDEQKANKTSPCIHIKKKQKRINYTLFANILLNCHFVSLTDYLIGKNCFWQFFLCCDGILLFQKREKVWYH